MDAPRYVVKEVCGLRNEPLLCWMQRKCLPDDKLAEPTEDDYWWLVFLAGQPVAFAGLSPIANWKEPAGYMCRAGVMCEHRGHGLQRRLITARIKKAKALGWIHLVTTTFDNPPSANNLISLGFRQYIPRDPWGALGTCYWIKDVTK